MRSRTLIVGIILVLGLATAAFAGSGNGTGWRVSASSFVPEPDTAAWRYAVTETGLTFKPGVTGGVWFQKSIDLTPPDGGFWNALTVHYDAPEEGALIWVGMYRQDQSTGETTLMGSVNSGLYPMESNPTVCLTEAIQDPDRNGRAYSYSIKAGFYRRQSTTAAPVLRGAAVTQWVDWLPGPGLNCPQP